MERTNFRSPLCTHHPVLPRDQLVFLFEVCVDRAKYLQFDVRRLGRGEWNFVADRFNKRFEGKRIPGRGRRQGKTSIKMLCCALKGSLEEFQTRVIEAREAFFAEKLGVQKKLEAQNK